jgi:hypothetical protein
LAAGKQLAANASVVRRLPHARLAKGLDESRHDVKHGAALIN